MTIKKTTHAIFLTVAVVLTVFFTCGQISSDDAYGQQYTNSSQPIERTISVTGKATTSIMPDLVNIQFGVDTQAKTAQDAIVENSKVMNSVVLAIQKLGITKNETSTVDFTIYPVYNNTGPYPPFNTYKTELVGYKVSNMILVKTTKMDLSGSILDAAVGAGANRVSNIAFSLSPAKQQSIQDELLTQAILNAKYRAENALDPLSQKIIGVKNIDVSEFSQPPPTPIRTFETMAPSAMEKTPIFTSNQDVTTTVSVTFLIGDK